MPCLTPYRGDTSQMLLFKIASCLEASGGSVTAAEIVAALGCTPACEGDVVNSFNGQVGDVVLTLADISTLADGRYVLKAGDTMTGALAHPDGTDALPSITFSGDTNTGIYRIGADTLGFSTAGVLAFTIGSTGSVTSAAGITSGTSVTVGTILQFPGSSKIFPPFNGGLRFTDAAQTDFSLLQFGGGTAAFPAIKRSGATIQFRLADDSAFADIATAAIVMSVGAPLSITSGANQRAGNAVLVAGTVTVANTSVTANTIVLLTRKTAGGTLGTAITYTVSAGASFTINSDSVIDTSTFSYLLIEVP